MSKSMQLKARIKNLAIKNHVPAQAVLQDFMLERLLSLRITWWSSFFWVSNNPRSSSSFCLAYESVMRLLCW